VKEWGSESGELIWWGELEVDVDCRLISTTESIKWWVNALLASWCCFIYCCDIRQKCIYIFRFLITDTFQGQQVIGFLLADLFRSALIISPWHVISIRFYHTWQTILVQYVWLLSYMLIIGNRQKCIVSLWTKTESVFFVILYWLYLALFAVYNFKNVTNHFI